MLVFCQFTKQLFTHLQISIDDAPSVQIVKCQNDLTGVETGARLSEESLTREVKEELAAVDVLHHKTQQVLRLKRVFERLKGREKVVFMRGLIKPK